MTVTSHGHWHCQDARVLGFRLRVYIPSLHGTEVELRVSEARPSGPSNSSSGRTQPLGPGHTPVRAALSEVGVRRTQSLSH